MWSISDPTKIVIPVDGIYMIVGQINVEGFTVDRELIAAIRVNAADTNLWHRGPGGEETAFSLDWQVTGVLRLTAGQYVQLYGYSSIAVAIDGRSSLTVARVG